MPFRALVHGCVMGKATGDNGVHHKVKKNLTHRMSLFSTHNRTLDKSFRMNYGSVCAHLWREIHICPVFLGFFYQNLKRSDHFILTVIRNLHNTFISLWNNRCGMTFTGRVFSSRSESSKSGNLQWCFPKFSPFFTFSTSKHLSTWI